MITPPHGVESTGEIVETAPRPGPLLLLVAVEFEARQLARRLGLAREPSTPGPVVLRRVGLAAADLPRLASGLVALRPAGVVVAGLAGGCAPDVRSGEIVVGGATASAADGEWLVPDAALTERALAALAAAGVPYRVGRLLTVPELVTSPAAKAGCWQGRGAVAVDMESAHVLRWAREAGVPALAVRAVADGPADPVPRALLEAVDAGGRLRPSALLGWARHPALVASAWRLWRRSRVALDHLARFLAALTADRP